MGRWGRSRQAVAPACHGILILKRPPHQTQLLSSPGLVFACTLALPLLAVRAPRACCGRGGGRGCGLTAGLRLPLRAAGCPLTLLNTLVSYLKPLKDAVRVVGGPVMPDVTRGFCRVTKGSRLLALTTWLALSVARVRAYASLWWPKPREMPCVRLSHYLVPRTPCSSKCLWFSLGRGNWLCGI
jgi:hypothetical protein